MDAQLEQPIDQNLWWVVPGKLAGVRKPEAEELPILKTRGVGAIVSVMDDPANLELYQSIGLPSLWLPIRGGSVPEIAQIQKLRRFVAEHNQAGSAVAVHCTNGRRRTGTMLAAWLIYTGQTFEQAMATILNAKPEIDLRETQLNFLKSLDCSCNVSEADG